MLIAFYFSFTDWNGLTSNIHFTGLQNFLEMLKDERVGHSIKVTLTFTVVEVIVLNGFGLFFAVILNNAGKLTNLYRSIFFIPVVFSTVAVSFIWTSILSYSGVLNTFLGFLRLENLQMNWIGDEKTAVYSLCAIEAWRAMGFHMVILLAALQTVPNELYEACTIDGGNRWDKFRHVTLPMIVPGLTISLLMSIMGELKQFDIVKVVTDGGPGFATETVAYNIINRAFGMNMMGYASAIALVLFVVIAAVSVFQVKISQKLEVEQ
jgi:ABC-type sugar transport system permease subunit